MKLSTLQENFSRGLATVSRSVAARTQLPALSNVLLATDKGRLKLSATNLETGVNFWLGAKIEEEGAISIPAKILTEFVSSLPAERIELKSREGSLQLNCASYQASFVGLPASEFPSVPTLKSKEVVFFDSQILSQAVSQVAFAAAQDEGRPVLTGVLIMAKNKNLILVSTDGYRLSLKKIKIIKGLEEFKKGLIIPSRTLSEVARIIGEREQEKKVGLTITPESNQVIFSTAEVEVVSRLIEGEFPEFEKIIPEKGTTKVLLDKEEFIRAVKSAAIFARESANIVRLKIDGSKLKISANAPQIGDNLVEVGAEIEGKKDKIAFNSRYLLDFLNVVEAKQISFEMEGSASPGVFTPVGDASFLHLIMPVRVQE